MAISGIGSYNTSSNTSSVAGRDWSRTSPADMLAAASELAAGGDSKSGEVKNYDFTSMTPKEMRGFADQLWRDGKIDLTQNLMLQRMGIPLGKLGTHGEFIPLSAGELTQYENKPVNYFDIGNGAMDALEQMGRAEDPQYGYQNWKQILSVLDTLQGSPKSVDLTA